MIRYHVYSEGRDVVWDIRYDIYRMSHLCNDSNLWLGLSEMHCHVFRICWIPISKSIIIHRNNDVVSEQWFSYRLGRLDCGLRASRPPPAQAYINLLWRQVHKLDTDSIIRIKWYYTTLWWKVISHIIIIICIELSNFISHFPTSFLLFNWRPELSNFDLFNLDLSSFISIFPA